MAFWSQCSVLGLHLIYTEGTFYPLQYGEALQEVLLYQVQSSLLSVLREFPFVVVTLGATEDQKILLTTHEPVRGEVGACLFLRASLYTCFLFVLWCLTSESPERLGGAPHREQGYPGKDAALRNVFCLDLWRIWQRIAGLSCVALFQ